MATIILGTVGRVFGGPLGGLVGAAVGGLLDRSILGGGGRSREVGRTDNLVVQSAAYGEPIPVITGTMRAAGNLLWTSGIKESQSRSGGGKRSGPATTSYTYSASFAVGLAGRAISDVGRIWADGKKIRDADGTFMSPVTMRLHNGSETQLPDPLIAAFEGSAGAPGYRGIAYVVFEDLPLADYGNRIPNLTFEVVADAGADHGIGEAIATMMQVDGRVVASVSGEFSRINGHFAGNGGSVADAVAPLVDIAGATITTRSGLNVQGRGGPITSIPGSDCHAQLPADRRPPERQRRLGGGDQANCIELGFYDTSRDFQPGLQRARRMAGGAVDRVAIACAMTPDAAKTLATELLGRNGARRLVSSVRLPWRYLAVQPGDTVQLDGDATVWQVSELRFENFIVNLELQRVDTMVPAAASGDGGRALAFDDQPAGSTSFHVLDLPPLPGDLSERPRLWIAAAGASTGWRRAAFLASSDAGGSYEFAGVAEAATVQGVALTALAEGSVAGWDRFHAVDVQLLSDSMWLEGKTETSVLSGANLALLGDEILQFQAVQPLAPLRFRLSGLLRGRRGTEALVASHRVGERFVLLDQGTLLPFDLPVEALGRPLRIKAAGAGDAATGVADVSVGGASLRPLAPVELKLVVASGGVSAAWTRRSRAGFGWPDFVDAPLAETSESYRVEVRLDSRLVRTVVVDVPVYTYTAADRLADGNGTVLTIDVAQISASVGPGEPLSATTTLST